MCEIISKNGEEGRKKRGQTHRQHAFAVLLNELMQCTYKDSGLSILALIVYSAFGIALHYLKIMIHVEEVKKFKQG